MGGWRGVGAGASSSEALVTLKSRCCGSCRNRKTVSGEGCRGFDAGVWREKLGWEKGEDGIGRAGVWVGMIVGSRRE